MTPIAEVNGAKVVSFEDSVTLSTAEAISPTPDIGDRKFNDDGTRARTRALSTAINPDNYFANRYKLVKTKGELHLVIDYRSIQYKREGKPCGMATVPCYVFIRDEKKQLKLDRLTTITNTEFDSSFNSELSHKACAELKNIIGTSLDVVSGGDDMPI